MAKKAKKAAGYVLEIRKLLEAKKIVMGTDEVMKLLKLGKVAKVFVTVNCPDSTKEDIEKYARISKAEVVQLDIPNEELGVVCKKPFSISVAAIVKE